MLNLSKIQIFFSAIIAGIILVIAAYYYYQFETSSIQKEKYEYLNVVANLKIDQITKWQFERLSEAKFFPSVGKFIKSTVFLSEDKGDKEARSYLVKTLLPIKEQHKYKNIFITDTSGDVLFSLDSSFTYVDSVINNNIKAAVEKDSIFVSDFYFSHSHSEIHLDIYSPIKDNNKKIIGIFVLQINPQEYLFPMIQKWPAAGKSAETLICRKEGNAVRILTEGKTLKNDSMNIVIPFSKSDNVIVKGIFEGAGVVEGVDYKNSDVLAAIYPIKETDWYLISKVDKDEIYQDLFFKGRMIIVLLFISSLLILVTALYLYHLRQSKIYKNLFFKERELYETLEKYKTTLYSIADAVITTDAEGYIKNMNTVAEQLTQSKEIESCGKKLTEIIKIVNEDSNTEVEDPVKKVLKTHSVIGLANHTLLIRKDGSSIPISDSASPIKDDKGNILGVVLVFRDQTEERIKEVKLNESNQKYFKILNSSTDSISLTELNTGKILEVNDGFEQIFGFTRKEALGHTSLELGLWTKPEVRDSITSLLKLNGKVRNIEAVGKRKNGELFTGLLSGEIIIINNQSLMLLFVRDITERKIIEDNLRASEEKFKMLLDFAPNAFFHGDINGNFITVNNNACELTGYTRNELLSMNMRDLFPKEVLETNPLQYYALKAGETRKTERLVLRKDGKKISVEMISKQMPDGTYQSFLRDLTEQKKAEKEFLEAEERFRKAFITSPDSININRLSDGKYVSINAGFTRITGYEEHEVIGKTSADIKIWADIKYRNELVELLSKNNIVENFEAKFRTKDGTVIDGLMSAAVIELKGEPHIISITRDISERKKLLNEIIESEVKFRSIWESSNDAMRLIDENGIIINVNQSYCNLFSLKKEQLIGKLFNIPYIIRDKDKSLAGFRNRFKNRTIQKKFEAEIQLINGRMIWVELTNSFIEFEDKNPMLLSIIRDISDRKKLINQLTESKTKAEEMVKLKSYFFANMSHELRTPFVGILGFAEILKDTLQNPTEREYAEQILKSSKRLTETLNKILNVTRLEFDKVDIKIAEFDVVKMLKDVESLYTNSAKINKTIISTVTDEKTIKIKSDPKLLEDILNNLVNNAVKFTHNGYIKLSASRTTLKDNPGIKITVEDSGIGIPQDKQQLVWQEFRQASEGLNRSFEGTGLGLTISKKYAEFLGGSITLQSEERKGSIFTITLPLNYTGVITEAEKTLPITQVKSQPQKQTFGKPKILYVEDDFVALQFIKIVLKSSYDIETAFSATEALQKVAIKKYDTLMLDINLGSGMDGLELMQKIRENDYYKKIPIVAVTAYASEYDKAEFLAKGFNFYISKPFTQKELLKLLSEIFSLK